MIYNHELADIDTETIKWSQFLYENALKKIDEFLKHSPQFSKELKKVTSNNNYNIKIEPQSDKNKGYKANSKTKTKFKRNDKSDQAGSKDASCYRCGYSNHSHDQCRFKNHPDANSDPNKKFQGL
jgi:hypothetical protein